MNNAAVAIKLITFDLGNVLVKVDHLEFCRRLAALAGVSSEKIYADIFNSELEPGYDTGAISTEQFYQRVLAHYNLSLNFDRFAQWWNSLFSPMPEMEEVVARLAQNYPLFLLSNTNALHFAYIREHYPILEHFSAFVLSFEVGSRKPEKDIYQHLLERAGVAPASLLFIDDKLPFVLAAREQGLRAWQFTSVDALKRGLQTHGLW